MLKQLRVIVDENNYEEVYAKLRSLNLNVLDEDKDEWATCINVIFTFTFFFINLILF